MNSFAEVQRGGKEPYYESFQFEQPPKDFTHLNMTPFFKGTPNHVFSNQWNTLYELYQGEGDVKRDFFRKETEPLFAPKKERQPNYNNEYEHIYDQREVYERVNPETMHNFERPKGTRIFTGIGVDPYYRKDKPTDDEYSYESCPSYDWYRIPVQDLEERRNKTRPNFNVTKQVFSGARPIHHQNLNMFMQNKIKNETFYKNTPEQYLNTTGAIQKNNIVPDAALKKTPNRNAYTKSSYYAPPSAENYGETKRGVTRNTHRKTGDLPSRRGNVQSSINLPKLAGKNNIRNSTLIKEHNILQNKRTTINNLPDGSYVKNPKDLPRNTKRQDYLANKHAGQFYATVDGTYVKNYKDLPKNTKRQDYLANKHAGQINMPHEKGIIRNANAKNTKREQYVNNNRKGLATGLINKSKLRDLKSIQLKPTHRYSASIIAGQRKSNIQSINSAAPMFDRSDVSQARHTKKETTMYNNNGNVTGNYTKDTLRNNFNAKTTKKEHIVEYIPSGGANYAADPHYYDPKTLTHNVKKYSTHYKFTDVGAQRFGNSKMPKHKLKKELTRENFTELENRNKINPNGMNRYTNQYTDTNMMPEFTQKNNKLPEVNSRCITL
jgi:hypothetical protein